jgi:hypothetical protein
MEFPCCRPFFYRDPLNTDNGIVFCMDKAEKIVKGCRRTLSHHLDRAIREVPNNAVHPGDVRTFRNIVPVAYTLHPAMCHGGYPFHTIRSGTGFVIKVRK